MDSVGNMNHAVSVVEKCTFDSNYKKDLLLNIDSLNAMCSCSDEDYYFATFQVLFYALRRVKPKEIPKRVQE